jgi:hypothetical protein
MSVRGVLEQLKFVIGRTLTCAADVERGLPGMTQTEPFYARRRMRHMRALIRNATDFAHKGPVQDATVSLLRDIADDLASRAEGEHEDAYYFIVRCMGAIAQAEAAKAYAPYNFINPFASRPPVSASQPPVPATPLWKWPVVNHPPPGEGGFAAGTFREYSALKMFGYTVGKTDGWPPARRHAFLSDFMTMLLPPIVVRTFGEEYGEPLTTTRLRKVANVIASNATNFYRNDPVRYRVAISDWEADLSFLYDEFYCRRGLAIKPWPSSRPS